MDRSIYREEYVNVGENERAVSVLTGVGLLVGSLMIGKRRAIPLAVAGGYFLYRAATGNDLFYRMLNINRAKDGQSGIRIERAVTVNRPISEVYQFWRQLENLPRFMHNLEVVQQLGGGRSRWVAKAPLGGQVEWEAQITQEEKDRIIAWQSLPESEIENEGVVRFHLAPGERGTEVYVRMEYRPPLGSAGAAVAKLFGEEPDWQIREDLRRFKQILEAGELPTTEGQSSGREVTGQI